eukprot:1133528-Pelagomonas_calceolata.AAC.2
MKWSPAAACQGCGWWGPHAPEPKALPVFVGLGCRYTASAAMTRRCAPSCPSQETLRHSVDPALSQVITGSHDSTIRLWDLRTAKTMSTLTFHKKRCGLLSGTGHKLPSQFVSSIRSTHHCLNVKGYSYCASLGHSPVSGSGRGQLEKRLKMNAVGRQGLNVV